MLKKISLFLLLLVSTTSVFSQVAHVKWYFSTKKVSDCEYDLKFSAEIEEGWHMYSINKSEDGPLPTVFKFRKTEGVELGKLSQSKPIKEFDKVFEAKVEYFEHTASFTQRVILKTDKKVTIKGEYEWQVCTDSKCEVSPPGETFEFTVEGTPACLASATITKTGTETANPPAACVCDTDAIVAAVNNANDPKADIVPKPAKKVEAMVQSELKKQDEDGGCHPWSKFLLGLLAGLGAVLMPCVYSLIPLTVSFFVKRSKTRAEGIRNSMLYGFFIIVTFVIPTMLIVIAFGPDALSNIATNTWLNIFFFVLFVIFALSFFGLFEITLPNSWGNKLDQKADKGGVLGIFFMAATLVVISFSCTAGFLGTLLATLAEGKSYLCPFMGFTGFGTGIALPFMVFAFFPSMLNSLPKSGGWMTTFKVTVAFIELALAVKFLANADNVNEWGFITREVFITLWVAIFGMMTLYLLGLFRTSHDSEIKHISVGRILFATISLAFTIYLIPGLWGAPLKIISSFPPPHHYAESPNGFGGHGGGATAAVSTSTVPEIAALENMRVTGPEGIKLFKDDYESALKYARLVNKPLFLDFTGNACVNCRYMESNVWVTPEVLPILRDSVVIVSLYVDSRVELPAAEQKEVEWSGKQRTLSTVGNKNAFMQITKYGSSSQPQYVVLNHDESNATPGTMGTERDQNIFAAWLKSGLTNFKEKK
jgi:thiol:disulfide interchange protein DsbD